MLLQPRTQQTIYILSKKYVISIDKLYICIALVNIRNIYVTCSHCGSIHFNLARMYLHNKYKNNSGLSTL